jgi:hypothetical protein
VPATDPAASQPAGSVPEPFATPAQQASSVPPSPGAQPAPPYPGAPSYPYPYAQPYWGVPSAPSTPSTAMATASGVLGIVGLGMSLIPTVYWFFYKLTVIDAQTYSGVSGVNTLMGADFVVATLAIVFGAVSLTRAGNPGGSRRGLAKIGVILGVVGLVLAVIFLPLAVSAANTASCSAYNNC